MAIPEGYTIYEKVIIQGPLTVTDLFTKLKADYNVKCLYLTAGDVAIYNEYTHGKSNRSTRIIEEVYLELSQVSIPEGRAYLVLEVGGEELEERCEFSMPPIKYYFKQ